jgi:Na+(H+)/acetate symporter ActP
MVTVLVRYRMELDMDLIDTAVFLGWSALMLLIGFDGWWLLGLQAGWLLVSLTRRKLIDRKR